MSKILWKLPLLLLQVMGIVCSVLFISGEKYQPDISAESLELNYYELEIYDTDIEGKALTAKISPGNAANSTVLWVSSDEKIVTVDSNGKIFPVSVGQASVTAMTEDGKIKAYCTVAVIEAFEWPIKEKNIITSRFGPRGSFRTDNGKMTGTFHGGVDIATYHKKAEVFPTKSGSVYKTGYDARGGNFVIIKHSDSLYSYYSHLSLINAKSESCVKKDTVIGKTGETARHGNPSAFFFQ